MEPLWTQNGVYALFLSDGMRLNPGACERFRAYAAKGGDFIYADMRLDKPDGTHVTVHKPAWSPDTLLSMPYIASPIAVKQALVDSVGAPCSASGDELYAFTLRATERAYRILNIPETLAVGDAKPLKCQKQIVTQALKRRNIAAKVCNGLTADSVAVRKTLSMGYVISVVIFTHGQPQAVRRTLESFVCRNTYPHTEWIVCDGGPPSNEAERYYASLVNNGSVRLIRRFCDYNLAGLLNDAARMARGESLLFVPAGVGIDSFDAAERMAECTQFSHVGAVGARMRDAADGRWAVIRNVASVEGVLLIRRDVFMGAGCLDETFAQKGFFMALCRTLTWQRRFHVLTPFAGFSHLTDARFPQATQKNKLRIRDMAGSKS